VGIKDVAASAGVSIGTVSNVLNHPERVSEPTRERVQDAITALGFVRNESGRQLRVGQSLTFAYVMLNASNPFFTDVARGVEEVARANGLALFICNSDGDASREADYLGLLVHHRVRGVLVSPVGDADPAVDLMERYGLPVVLVDHRSGSRCCSVRVDDVEGGTLAVTHLLQEGYERIAFVGGPLTVPHVADRLAGARLALQAAGRPPDALTVVETTALSAAEGRRAGQVIAARVRTRRPTAAFCANDLVALGLLQEMSRMRLDVPADLAIVGYDDIEFAGAAATPLSSVRQPRDLLGRTAAQLLLAEADADDSHVHQELLFHPELVVRASSSPRPT
jgi:LacI family transcriptional regulator, galactose operon repressor